MNTAPSHAALDPSEEAQLLDTIERWVARELKPIVREYDHADQYPTHIVEQMKELGLFGATVGAEYGGLGLPAVTYAKIIMSISSVWMSITGIINSHLMLALAIEKFGTSEQKRCWLPKLASGEIRGGLALTEPDAGTDLQAIRMHARRDGDHYVINGTKTWITNGAEGSCFAMLVKTDPAVEPRHKGMSLFITPKMKGFTVGRRLEKLGYKAIDSAELVFEDYRVPADHLIGGVEGQGFYQATGGLELGRINVAARGVGIAEGALKLATDYAQTRKTFGKPICEHQAIQLKLGEMATRARAARLLTLDAASAFDRRERCDMEAGMAKYFASEAALENSIESMRIHGAYGYSKEFDIERLYRDAPLTCIGEGTNEMQRIIISKQWVKRNQIGMKPLHGLRIISVEQFGAAPYGTMFLADLGADVIKVENAATGGDPARKTGPYLLGSNDSEYFQVFNVNKKSVALDLRTAAGKAALIKLVETADALVNNLRGDLPAKMGLDYRSLASVKPAIVCAHVSAYGRDNERASWPGYDYLMQAESGLMHLTGEPDGPPSRIGAPSMVDQATGLTAAVGLLSAIIQARATGKGCDVDTCLLDVALHQLGYVASWYINEGHASTRQHRSAHYSVAPVQTFPTADGWLFVMCMTDKFWSELVDALGRPDLKADPRFAAPASRQANRDTLSAILDEEFRERPTSHWLEKLNGVLPVAPVLDLAQALDNPFLRATEMIRDLPHPAKPGMRTLANPIKIDGKRLDQTACSQMGADNAAFVAEPLAAKRAGAP